MGALLKLGADIHATYHNADIGSSPLFLAAWYGEIDVVRFLLSKGAEAMTKDPKGRNILHYLAFCQLDYHGSLPYSWHYWIRHGDWDEHIKQTTELAKLLIDAGADINAVSQVPRQTTPIRIASEEWDGGVVCALAQLGADVETGTMDTGTTLLRIYGFQVGDLLTQKP